jgi:hypothetical protein
MKYTINYEYGVAQLFTPEDDWKNRFYTLASQCFGIRKSIGEVRLISKENVSPTLLYVGEYERLEHSGGDQIIWNASGEKIKSEWD